MTLTGALFVLGALGAFSVANTPDGDANAAAVITHYADNRAQGIVASIILALAAIPALAFGARLRERAACDGRPRHLAELHLPALESVSARQGV